MNLLPMCPVHLLPLTPVQTVGERVRVRGEKMVRSCPEIFIEFLTYQTRVAKRSPNNGEGVERVWGEGEVGETCKGRYKGTRADTLSRSRGEAFANIRGQTVR